MHRALEAAEAWAGEGIECEVIDLRTIQPLDVTAMADSVRRTHHLLVVDEGWSGFGVELGQAMNELAFDFLDAPAARLHTEPVTHPFGPALERAMLVDAGRIVDTARRVLARTAPAPTRWTGGLTGAHVASPSRVTATPVAKAAPAISVEGEPINMPLDDRTISEGKLVRWLHPDGAMVKAGGIVAEIETDKAVVEIEAPAPGRLRVIVAEIGTVVPMGGAIGAVLAT